MCAPEARFDFFLDYKFNDGKIKMSISFLGLLRVCNMQKAKVEEEPFTHFLKIFCKVYKTNPTLELLKEERHPLPL